MKSHEIGQETGLIASRLVYGILRIHTTGDDAEAIFVSLPLPPYCLLF